MLTAFYALIAPRLPSLPSNLLVVPRQIALPFFSCSRVSHPPPSHPEFSEGPDLLRSDSTTLLAPALPCRQPLPSSAAPSTPLSHVPSAHSYLGSLHGSCLGLLRRRPLAVFSPRRSDSLSPGPALSLGCPSARRAAVAPPPCPSQPREVGSGKQEIRDGAFLPLPAPCFSAPYFSAPRFPLSASHFSASHFLLPTFCFPPSPSRFLLPASRFPLPVPVSRETPFTSPVAQNGHDQSLKVTGRDARDAPCLTQRSGLCR